MAHIESELNQLINPAVGQLKGSLGISTTVVEVSSRPGFVWVRLLENRSELIRAHNYKVTPIYDLPVILEFDGIKYEIIGVDTDRYVQWNTNFSFLPNHGRQHSAIRGSEGTDIVWVDSQQILPLLVTPPTTTGSNSVNINQYQYKNSENSWLSVGGTGFSGITPLDVSGSNLYLLMLNDADGSLYSITGSVFPASVSGTSSVLSYLPGIPATNKDIPLAAIRANPGAAVGWRDIYDVRQFFSKSGGNITGVIGDIENLTSQVDGTGTHFTMNSSASSIGVFIEGVLQPEIVVFTPGTSSFDLTSAPLITDSLAVLKMVEAPDSSIKKYDSGWFAINTSQKITLNHNLGTQALNISVYLDNDSGGATGQLHHSYSEPATIYGASVQINNNDDSVDIVMGTAGYVKRNNSGGYSGVITTNIYCRVVILGF